MRREVAWEATAAKQFDALPEPVRERILSALAVLAIESRGDVRPLQGHEGMFRLRVGEYRVLFVRVGDALVVQRVAPRGSAYR